MIYVDFYLLPVPKKNLAKYKSIATRFGKLAREYGALDYCEAVADELPAKGPSFAKAAGCGRGEVTIASYISFKSKAQRDRIMKALMADERMQKMANEDPVADMEKMYYGGFQTIVKL